MPHPYILSDGKLDKYYKHINDGLNPGKYVGHKKLQNTVTDLRNSFNNESFKKALSSIGAVLSFFSGTLGAGLSILSNFFSKSNSKVIQTVSLMPLVSQETTSMSGTVTI